MSNNQAQTSNSTHFEQRIYDLKQSPQLTDATTAAAKPASSVRTVTLVVTPVRDEYAIRTSAAIRLPITVLP